MLFIYTRKPNNFFSKEFLKLILRSLFRKSRGPQAVNRSLITGLNELDYDYRLNFCSPQLDGTATFFVNTSIGALRWAICLKNKKKIKRVIAGPNLVVMPDNFSHLVLSPEIDIILVPSDWVKELWLSNAPELSGRVFVWAAGVDDFGLNETQGGERKPLLYIKNIPDEVIIGVESILREENIDYDIIRYGEFIRQEYLDKLDRTNFMIYLQNSESQGISLLEAWGKGVPTLVWSCGYFEYDSKKFYAKNIAAPYLNDESGRFFATPNELKDLLKLIKSGGIKFYPREYYINNFTNKICAEKFLKIIQNWE